MNNFEFNKALLQSLHLLTRDGKLNQDANRKLKQIHHLLNFIEPILIECSKKNDDIVVCDLGAGKSYLGFLVYDYFKAKYPKLKIFSVEWRRDIVETCVKLASQQGFADMQFIQSSIRDARELNLIPSKITLTLALHACDTATDDAIDFSFEKKSDYILLVPCCQATLANILRKNKNQALSETAFAELWRHPIHTREFGSLTTNVLRSLYLQAMGYHVSVTELIGWEHSLKNELIVGKFTGELNSSSKSRMIKIINDLGASDFMQYFKHVL